MTREDILQDAGITIDPRSVSLPFGRHEGKPLAAVPLLYLQWLVRDGRVSGALADAVRAEVARRESAWSVRPAAPNLEDVVEAVRRTMAKGFHPDVGGDTRAMQAVNQTCDLLQAKLRERKR